jgi:hypothetical protein
MRSRPTQRSALRFDGILWDRLALAAYLAPTFWLNDGSVLVAVLVTGAGKLISAPIFSPPQARFGWNTRSIRLPRSRSESVISPSSRSRNASRRSQNGSNSTVIAAGGTGTLPKLVANASLVGVYCSTTCYGSGYFRHCATTMFLIEDNRWPVRHPGAMANLGLPFGAPIFLYAFEKDQR